MHASSIDRFKQRPVLVGVSGTTGTSYRRLDGLVVFGWPHRRSGEIRYELLEDVGAEARQAIEARVAALTAWLDALRFLPRFRTPLEQELTA